MSRLRRKLDRLSASERGAPATASSELGAQRQPALPEPGAPASVPSDLGAPATFEVAELESRPSPELETTPLAALRAKLADATGGAAVSQTALRAGMLLSPELDFERRDSEWGSLWCRRQQFERAARVGAYPLAGAFEAEAELLALLALDAGLAGCDFKRALYFDTETTGLGGGAGTLAFLVGVGHFDATGSLVVEQWMLEAPGQEVPLLRRLSDLVEASDVLIGFNGKAFDWPLLRGRYVMNRLPPPPSRPQLDLLHLARRVHRPRVPRCTLKHLERSVLGFARSGDIDGAEVPARWAQFLRTQDSAWLSDVASHNLLDVTSMAALVAFYGEPYERMHVDDALGMARTFKRARAFERAMGAATAALEGGEPARALRVRAEIAKAGGDKRRALRDFESALQCVDDAEVRLQLAKLYEHYARDPGRALAVARLGTGETTAALDKRLARLQRKIERRALNEEEK